MSFQQWGQPSRGPAPYGGVPYGQPYGQPARSPWTGAPSYPGSGFGQPLDRFGGFGYPGPPPRRRRSPLKLLMLSLMVVALASLAAFAITGTTSAPSDTAYQNDDYRVPAPDKNPPPIPVPETYEEAEQIITDSPFYAQTAPAPVRCNAQPINVGTASDAQLKSHFEGMMECLVRVWQPPVTAARLLIVRPSVTIYGTKMTTRCGTSGVNAFYCAADQQIYYSNRLADAVPIVRQDKWAADVVIAHEFGHALQGRTGILISAKALGQDSGDEQTDLLYSRRLETQADCFSGMFMRSVSTSLGIKQADLEGIELTYKAVGDDTVSGDPSIQGNHGLARSRLYWGSAGLGTGAVGRCNTFTAPASQVR